MKGKLCLKCKNPIEGYSQGYPYFCSKCESLRDYYERQCHTSRQERRRGDVLDCRRNMDV